MKLVYAVDQKSYNSSDHIGVRKKVQSQMQQFERAGVTTTLCEYEWKDGFPQIEVDTDTDLLYFRRIEASLKMILKLRELKKKSPKLRIMMEIPVYPFVERAEDKSLKKRVNRFIGIHGMKHCIDRIVLIGKGPAKVYGIPTIIASNGVDYQNVKIRQKDAAYAKKYPGIHMICVSGCTRVHGYDRLIEGMHEYYEQNPKAENVYLHVVGQGRCLPEYKELAEKYGMMEKNIFFYGTQLGEELDKIYERCDIGIVTLSMYLSKMISSTAIKASEYAAKGIPLVTDIELDISNGGTEKYIVTVPSQAGPVNVKTIVDRYHQIYDGKSVEQVSEEIREIFRPYCDWTYAFKPVIDYMKKL
ncbi:MAG: glycosyltransferase [Lachnospiraceae bacterium]|nr:glycosyltransferase [Lachnospiraceae bacterium]